MERGSQSPDLAVLHPLSIHGEGAWGVRSRGPASHPSPSLRRGTRYPPTVSASVPPVPSLPPPRGLAEALVTRIVEALEGALPLPPDELRRRVVPALESVVVQHT